jgi:hypothetical protein
MDEYVTLIISCQLKSDVPEPTLAVLRYLADKRNPKNLEDVPDHPFFKTENWEQALVSNGGLLWNARSSLEFVEEKKACFLNVRTSLKDGRKQIVHFLEWLAPYCKNGATFGTPPSLKSFFANVESDEAFEQLADNLDDGFIGYLKPENAAFPTLIYLEAGKVFFGKIKAMERKPAQDF